MKRGEPLAGLYTVSLAVFLAVYTAARGITGIIVPEDTGVRDRLQKVTGSWAVDSRKAELERPLWDRIVRPLLLSVAFLAKKMLPSALHESLEPQIVKAGNPGNLTANEFIGIKALLALGLPLLLYGSGFRAQGGIRLFLLLFTFFVAGWKAPDYYLKSRIEEQRKAMDKALPDVLDLLTVSVEAGLGFDGAMAKVAEKDFGPIGAEFRRVLQEIRVGNSRRDSLREMANRCASEDIGNFVNAIIHAEQMGIGIGKTLRGLSEQMRRKRRQQAEEQAMKAPVKMLIPLVLFIFPTIFLVLLGPAVIQLMEGLVR